MCLQIPEDRSKISLLESNTQLKPHKAQNYRKKALWVSWFSIIITLALVVAAFKRWKLEAEEDCGGVRQGDHQLTHKYVKNSSRYGTTPTKQPLGDSRRPQASRGDRLSSQKWEHGHKPPQQAAAAAVASVMSDSVWLRRRQPTRLPRPWDSPGKNTGVGCHVLLHPNKKSTQTIQPTVPSKGKNQKEEGISP